MRSRLLNSVFVVQIAIWLTLTPFANGQNLLDLFTHDRDTGWERVVTDTNLNIDVNTSSLVLESSGMFHAVFRTILSKSEDLSEKPGSKYKTRFETIQFDPKIYSYRVIETSLLDSSGKVVFASETGSEAKWRIIKGGTAGKLYDVISQLPPLGSWKVVSIKYIDSSPSAEEKIKFAKIIGTSASIRLDGFYLGENNCSRPGYESISIRNEEILNLTGHSFKDLGIPGERVDTLKIKCKLRDSSELNLLFSPSPERATLLSGGAILDLERSKY